MRSPALFWSKVAVAEGDACWLWLGYIDSHTGYGKFSTLAGKRIGAHRFSWMLRYGKTIPDGMEVCHRCDVRACVRPSHLFLGTRQDNCTDMAEKGRGRKANRVELAKFVLHVMGDMPSDTLAKVAGVSHMTAKRARKAVGLPKGNRWLKRQVETRRPVEA